MIQLSRDSEWLKPKEWAINHVANLRQHHGELHQRLTDMGRDPSLNVDSTEGHCPTVTQVQSDPSELERLQGKYDRLIESFEKAIDELARLYNGKEPDAEIYATVLEIVRTKKLKHL